MNRRFIPEMSEQQRQHLSALADGELDPGLTQATVTNLESSPELQATWERYHLIGSALHGEAINPRYREIAERVRAQLRSEPTVIAPGRSSVDRGSRLGRFGGIALAASAAFLAVFAVPKYFDTGERAAAPVPGVSAVSLPRQFQLNSHRQRWHLDQPALERKLDRFLVNHQARSPSAGIKGFLPYATVVGYEAGQ